jgi:hypothetical protein
MTSSDIPFRISTFSNSDSCVEVGRSSERIDVRNSNDREAGTVSFNRKEWAAFIAGAKAGEFDEFAL